MAGCERAQNSDKPAQAPPNFLVIVADDLGYSDIGAFGGEIETPNLDAIARSGMRLTSFYTTAACASTRAMLLTGVDNHRAGLGSVEFLLPQQRGQPGYELALNKEIPTIAERLQTLGYNTLMSGKWHLGKAPGYTPAERGFSHSFALLEGGHNHYNEPRITRDPSHYRLNGEAVAWPEGRYSSNVFSDYLLEFLAAPDVSQKPFFAYLSFTAPHWPLQAPAETIEKYRERYQAGYQVIAAERLARQKALGLVKPTTVPHPVDDTRAWDQLSKDEQLAEARKMAVYAAMVDNLDQNVGRVLKRLEAEGQLDNTYIIFMSDNGAEGNFGDVNGVSGFAAFKGGSLPAVFDNSLENLGRPNSLFAYGKGWAHVSEMPHRLYKTFATEGGLRNVAMISGPGVAAGQVLHTPLQVADIAPTLMALAGGVAETIPYQLGHSWVPLLHGQQTAIYDDTRVLAFELFGGAALRKGPWKITYVHGSDPGKGLATWEPGQWQLFNVVDDPGETRDLSGEYPTLFSGLIAQWGDYARDNQVVLISPETQQPQ